MNTIDCLRKKPIRENIKEGLCGIEKKYTKLIKISDNIQLYNINIEGHYRTIFSGKQQPNYWDYVLITQHFNFFIEFHPVTMKEINTIRKKYKWLKEMINNDKTDLFCFKDKNNNYYWCHKTYKLQQTLLKKVLPVKPITVINI